MIYVITRCPGCGRMCGVNGSTCKRPASRSAADLFSDSAPGDGRERGVPGRRPSEAPVKAGRNSLTSRRQDLPRASSPAATHPVPTSSTAAGDALPAAVRDAGLDPFPNAAASGIPAPGG